MAFEAMNSGSSPDLPAMKKLIILGYHALAFVIGSAGIVAYLFYRLSTTSSGAGVGGVIVMPAVALIYVVAFGILCVISLVIWLLVAYFRSRKL